MSRHNPSLRKPGSDAGDGPTVELYVRNQRRKAEHAGILFDEKSFSADISVDELRAAIFSTNVDPRSLSDLG